MAAPITRPVLPGQHTLDEAVIAEIERLRDEGELSGNRTEPRCYVCCEAESRELVNKMIAGGYTNREISESCEFINARRRGKKDDREISAWHVWAHKRNGHFDVDGPAIAVIREIIERRATEVNRDHVNGIGHAIVPYAVLETVMVKGMQGIVEATEPPTVKETLDASVKLHELTNRDAGQRRMADLLQQMDRIIVAAQKFVPLEEQEAFLAEVEGRAAPSRQPMQVLTERTHEIANKAIKEFSPPRGLDDGDEI